MTPLLSAEDLTLRAGERLLCHQLRCELRTNECLAILGTNGAGKTTLLHTLAGLRAPAKGRVLLKGRSITDISRRSVARVLGLLPQDLHDDFPASVWETALLGRTPFLPLWGGEAAEDRRLVQLALAEVELNDSAQRSITTLSGGERRRVAFATLLTQNPQIWLLDEPTNHLDLRHQRLMFEKIGKLAESGATIAMTLHDPNLAARYADRVLLLYGDGFWEVGKAEELLTADRLSTLYGSPIAATETALGRVFLPA